LSPTRSAVQARVHLALVAVQAMFASLSIAGKIALHDLPPRALIAVRAPAAALILMAVRFLLRPVERVPPRDLVAFAVLALFGIVVNQILFIEGLARTTATNAIVLNATIPVFTTGVAIALGRERATPFRLLGLAIAFVGALVVASGGARQGFRLDGDHLTGSALLLANSLSFAIYLVLSRPILQRYTTVTVVSWVMTFGALGVLPFGGGLLVGAASHVGANAWLAVAWIVLFPTVGTYFLNGYALRRAPASVVAIYIYLQPIFGAMMAAVVLDERPHAATLAGGVLIAGGIALVSGTRSG
jgi:drug/metabolite transporter (DMT)-like permease